MAAVGFFYPIAASATFTFVPSRQPVYPQADPVDYPWQLTAESAGGALYVQSKGARRRTFELQFERLAAADRNAALVFFDGVEKALKPFEYRDPDGGLHLVRWTNEFNIRQTANGRFSGSISLRRET